eukprot:GHVU01021271.1.p1 GENE.GHVU01021271.1~~GHVU01021271.1.p1  ORF type:complete len:252 (-),score=19.17 GHVU01021271.1:1436-2191(-)
MGRTTHTHTHTHTSTMGGPFCVIRTLRVVMQQLIHHHTRRPRPTDRPSLPISAIVVVIVVAAPLDSHCCCCVWPAPRPSIPVISVSSSSSSTPSALADPAAAAAAGSRGDLAGGAAGELGASSFTRTVVVPAAAALSYAASLPPLASVLPVGGITTTASSTVWGGQDARTDGHSPTRNLRTPSLRFTAPLQRARTRPAAKTEEGGGAPHSLTHSLTQSIDIHRSSALQFERNRRRINLTDRSGSHQHWTTS